MSPATRGSVGGPVGPVSYLSWPGPDSATPILFLHPVNTAAAVWSGVARELAGRWPAVAVDYRAHGESAAGGPYLPADYAADALAVLDALGIRRAHVVCGSIGGAVAVELAAAGDRVASITALGASLRLAWPEATLTAVEDDLRRKGVREWFTEHGADVLGPASRPQAAAELAELASRGRDVDVVVDVLRGTFGLADSRPAAEAVSASPPPAQVVLGAHDPTCPMEMARELAGFLRCEIRVLPDIGHLPMLEDPKGAAAVVSEFLAGLAEAGR
ncbi:alpha/beta fold hydrolase [Pseudonocardia bannensis]|uniref:Alpha/beta hydrolase n=1 Tax=Pseudonocardia bannensis TaxID=630973 RepID=A0A848DHR2_9PSEU|nr:alpha/beta hydrolase [Pseudonocardia bannensis]NMH92222.1 alpha/beta hydrolase [Pseudonocardia bannensis]